MQTEANLEALLLGPVLADRACGDCTACCTVLTVDTPEFRKAGGTPCVNLTPNGCGIHPTRPHICRTWFCGWRRTETMPDQARPDRSGLIVSLNFERSPRNCFEGVSIIVRTINAGQAIDKSMAAAVLDSLCDGFVPVWFSDGTNKMLMHPADDVAGLVLSGNPAPAHLRTEVASWRERYAIFGEPS